jgi:acetolactate synthase-1/2/3 large subunit
MIHALEKEGVQHIFGYPGATIAPFYDALIQSDIKHILVRHEQHAGHAASGYARVSGKPGVCVVTSGPGATNLITALATAYMDSIPIIAISGQVDSNLLGRDVFQEADITGATEPFTKYSYLVKDAADIPRIFKEAFHIASTGRPGPVLIDIPVDLQTDKAAMHFPDEVHLRGYNPTIKGHPGQVKRLVKEIRKAKRPILCVGGGVFNSHAEQNLAAFIDKAGIPTVCTLMGIGAVPTDSPLFMGQVGMHGDNLANEALSHADILILMGARVSDRAMMLPDKIKRKTKIIHVDIDPAEIGKNLDTYLPVVGDLNTILGQLLEYEVPEQVKLNREEWTKNLHDKAALMLTDETVRSGTVNPKAFAKELSKKLGDNYIYCQDVGQNQLWSAGNIEVRKGCKFLTTGGMGTMGYSIGAAVGARFATIEDGTQNARTVIAVCGDGSFQMCMMELATIVQQGLDVKVIVMRNGKLGLVREIQDKSYYGHHSEIDLTGSPDPALIAKAYGIDAYQASDIDTALGHVDKMLSSTRPALLVINVPDDESSL